MGNNYSFPSKEVKTRKVHFCWGCGDKYEKGSILQAVTGITSGEGYWGSYWCKICWAYQHSPGFHWNDYDDGEGISEDCFKDSRKYEEYRKKYIEELQYVNQ